MPRSIVVSIIRKHRWIPAFVSAAIATMFVVFGLVGVGRVTVVVLGICIAAACFVWGYSVSALRGVRWPVLDHLHRRRYAETWDTLAASPKQARAAACGECEEVKVRFSAQRPVSNITELAGIKITDDVLEIGCGVARIGLELAPRCKQWTGVDISTKMLACAADRLASLSNVRLVHLSAANLDAFSDSSFDLVYLTNMFDHLDGMDRYKYIMDAFRVLRPNGRLYVDNTDLESDAGWASFANGVATVQDFERPAYLPTPLTAGELTTYAKRAGFREIRAHHRSPLVILTATKP